jgi:hypothetical protein
VLCAAGLLFFTTYTLLVLFWAEIYHQARSMPTGSLRPIFIAFNALVYAAQVGVAGRLGGGGGMWHFVVMLPAVLSTLQSSNSCMQVGSL